MIKADNIRFSEAVTKILSVSRTEIKKREEEWRKQRKAKKLAKRIG